MCFIQTLILQCTVSEILAQIDHKGPNWTFLTLKMTFRVISHLHILGQYWFHNKEVTCDAINLSSTSLLKNNIINYGENGPNLTLFTLKVAF